MIACSVLIVSYRTPDLTVAAVESALEADPGVEVVVVDNASGDRSVATLRSRSSQRIHVIASSSNDGYGAAANRAADVSRGQTLVFLNSDAELSAEALNAISAEVASHNGRCIVGPRLLGSDGEIQRSAGLLPGPVDLAVRALGLNHAGAWLANRTSFGRLIRRTRLGREYESAVSAKQPIDTPMVSGACFAIGRNAFDELGGFDERFFLYFEDADLCWRAAAAGMPIRYVPDAVVTHVGGASSSEDYHFGPYHARSMRQYLGKWYGAGGSALAILLLWLRAIGFSVAFPARAKRAWRALWAALRDEDPRQ